jgi:hypothetical protein
MAQIPINGKDGKPILYAYIQFESLRLEYEVYGHGPDQRDQETIYSVEPEEYEVIAKKYGGSARDILAIMKHISDSGRGEEFKEDLASGAIKRDKFVW